MRVSMASSTDIDALWKAAKKHDVARVKQLLVQVSAATGSLAIVNEFHPRKRTTPLMAACLKRETEHKHPNLSAAQTVQLLLEFGADSALRARDRDGDTALHFAAACNQVRSVEFLVQAGVDAYAVNARGHSALDVARWHRSVDVVDVLTQLLRIHSGWLYVRTTKLRPNDATAKTSLRVWKKRWAVALACDTHHRVVELALFKDRDDARPQRVVLLRADTHQLVASPKKKWLDRHNMFHADRPLVVQKTRARRFSRDLQTSELLGETEIIQFAAESSAQREAWISILRHSVYGRPMPPGQLQLHSEPLLNRSQWQPEPPTPVVVIEPMLATNMTAPDSPYSLFGGSAPAPPAPLSPLGGGGTITVSPSQISAVQGVTTSPRHRDAPTAPSFAGTDDLRLSELTFYEQLSAPLIASSPPPQSAAVELSPPAASPAAASPHDSLPSRGECVICMDAPRDAICVPCGHIAGCYPCLVRQVQANSGCPICRAYAQTVVKIYEV